MGIGNYLTILMLCPSLIGTAALYVYRESMKAKLRAWLITLVREAIRLETRQFIAEVPVPLKTASKSVTAKIHVEPSFEQMQSDSISAQEKYYEPTV